MSRKHQGISLTLIFVLMLALMLALMSSLGGHALAGSPKTEIKILAIGNSFSDDAMHHMYRIAMDAGVENIVLGNLIIGGASLHTHWNNATQDHHAYRYEKNRGGGWIVRNGVSLLDGLLDEDWDIITLQQVSQDSGIPSSYTVGGRLQYLVDYIHQHKTNPDAIVGWHMTWAYQADAGHTGFSQYDRDQFYMYTSIVNAVRQNIVPNEGIDLIIPAGTAIQNVRTSSIGDVLTHDGYHLTQNLGRYIAALTWVHATTGLPIDDVTWVPNRRQIPEEYLEIIKEAVKNAVANPFAVTISSYVEDPHARAQRRASGAQRIDVNEDDYTLLDWDPEGCSYWNSQDNTFPTRLISRLNSNAGNLCFFVSSYDMFTREDIPVGSVIEIDPGYQYRPEGWVSLSRQSSREQPVTESQVLVDEGWWGDYIYRAFNVSNIGASLNVSGIEDEVASKFRIWVPKEK